MVKFFEKAASFLDRAPELWKENVELVELNRRVLWFIVLRFGVVGILLVLAGAKNIIIPHLSVPAAGIFIIAFVLLLMNIFYWFHYQWAVAYHEPGVYLPMLGMNVQVQIILDFLILGYIVYECGGLESPLIYFFLFHNMLSCLFFRKSISFLHTMISIAIILFIVSLTYFDIIPQRHFIKPEISAISVIPARLAVYYLAGVISIYIISWYLVSTITESLKVREKQLQGKIQEMIDLAREKTRYMLVTTHELKAPFAAIQSYVNVVLDGYAGELSDKLKEILWKIHARCSMLTQMITDMIQLANITSLKERPQEILMARVDMAPLIMNFLPRFKEVAAKKKVSFQTGDLQYEHHYLQANAEQLQILLNNIISNSLSYCFPETKIEISIDEKPQSFILKIKDQGIGIKKENLEKVFLEHFRSEKAVEINPNSTGLGLTIARQIMDIHRGHIWVESEEGVGTTVFLEFPKAVTG
jgi:signal transduction histidine kinase